MSNIWDELHKEAKKIIDDYYANQNKTFAEIMKISEDIAGVDPFNIYPGPELDPNLSGDLTPEPEVEMPIDQSSLDTEMSPFENMMLGGDNE